MKWVRVRWNTLARHGSSRISTSKGEANSKAEILILHCSIIHTLCIEWEMNQMESTLECNNSLLGSGRVDVLDILYYSKCTVK